MLGYSVDVLWNYRDQYWIWTPILGPIFGGLAGTFVYDIFIFTGKESIVNTPNAAARSHQAQEVVVGEAQLTAAAASPSSEYHPTHDVV